MELFLPSRSKSISNPALKRTASSYRLPYTLNFVLEDRMLPSRLANLIALIALSLPFSAVAANIAFISTRISADCASIRLTGEIRPGDTNVLAALVSKNRNGCRGQDIEPGILFDSPGGDVHEALRMGRYIRANKIGTSVEYGALCMSACNIAFIGGVSRTVDGRFGIHRPYVLELSADESNALNSYNAIVQTLKTYAVEMRVDSGLFDRMMKISPQDVAFLSRQEMTTLGVTGIDPVWEDVLISREAKALRISRQEFIQRQAATKTLCGTGLRPYPDPCSDAVMKTGRPPQ